MGRDNSIWSGTGANRAVAINVNQLGEISLCIASPLLGGGITKPGDVAPAFARFSRWSRGASCFPSKAAGRFGRWSPLFRAMGKGVCELSLLYQL